MGYSLGKHVLFIFSYFMMNLLFKKIQFISHTFFCTILFFLGQIKGQFNRID